MDIDHPAAPPLAAASGSAARRGPAPRRPLGVGRALRRFAGTPKGRMLGVLLGLLVLALPGAGTGALPVVAAAVVAAVALDVALELARTGTWRPPTGALLTALFVALILDTHTPWTIAAAAAAAGIAGKHLLRMRRANALNPAALGLVVATVAFGAGQSWWGALPDLPLPLLAVVAAAAFGVAAHVRKLPMALAFFGGYFGLATFAAFVGDPAPVAELFRVPGINAALFFAGTMLTDPPTSPTHTRDQLVYGVIVAAASVGIFLGLGGVYYLPAALLVGNGAEACRRWVLGRRSDRARSRLRAPLMSAAQSGRRGVPDTPAERPPVRP